MIYFAEAVGLNLIKIVFSEDPENRINYLNFSSPVRIDLIKTIKGSLFEEHYIHKRFKDIRIRGEWFQLTEELRSFIFNIEDNAFLNKIRMICFKLELIEKPLKG
ncbi:MAG: GIY-YIG nuclease family protein [Candidatus Lokiarchaeota archaeon]|nr:GIY-YIG nuclease family protein [Candidatus Lokiarchaeota archaeon]